LTPRPLGRDLGSAWSPKPGSEVQFLGSPHFSHLKVIASSAGGLRPPELIAGGFGNPLRVPIKMQGGLGPARPHKPGTRSVRFRPLQLECDLSRLLPLSLVGERVVRTADEVRAGRPRVARLQVGGRLVGRPSCPALQA